MLKRLLQSCVKKRLSLNPDPNAPQPESGHFESRIPTLQPEVFREASPMMKERYGEVGRWIDATHGHWLSAGDMAAFWSDSLSDPLLSEVWQQHLAAKGDWPNEASSMFQPQRLSLFAGSDIGNEKIYLLWLDEMPEPEIWVYDSNGESRYKDLKEYLKAYLSDDTSASELSWRA